MPNPAELPLMPLVNPRRLNLTEQLQGSPSLSAPLSFDSYDSQSISNSSFIPAQSETTDSPFRSISANPQNSSSASSLPGLRTLPVRVLRRVRKPRRTRSLSPSASLLVVSPSLQGASVRSPEFRQRVRFPTEVEAKEVEDVEKWHPPVDGGVGSPHEFQLMRKLFDPRPIDSSAVEAFCVNVTGGMHMHRSKTLSELASVLWPTRANNPDGALKHKYKALRLLEGQSAKFVLRVISEDILVLTERIYCLVEVDRVIFMGPSTPLRQAFIGEFCQGLRRDPMKKNFNMWAVECIICATLTVHQIRMQALKPVLSTVLSSVDFNASKETTLQLYPLKTTLSDLLDRVRPLVNGLQHACHNSTQGRRSQTTSGAKDRDGLKTRRFSFDSAVDGFKSRPISTSLEASGSRGDAQGGSCALHQVIDSDGTGHPLDTIRSELLTTDRSDFSNIILSGSVRLLEALDIAGGTIVGSVDLDPTIGIIEIVDKWKIRAKNLMAEIVSLDQTVQDATNFAEASLDLSRNRLLKLEVYTMVPTLVISFGGAVGAIFGMNLDSNIQHKPFLLWVVFAIMVLVGFVAIMKCGFCGKSEQEVTSLARSLGGNQFFGSFANDRYALSLDRDGEGNLSETAKQRIMADLGSPSLHTISRSFLSD
eukprot:TRINITY_DN55897_c0_g1_i1.p1 TRINITY_DN55897_c0_g1~~TRINITY_DN55897_c0_g1_i1.p1  ORF type:complete len:649 (-),score=60.59 TRINITY_DN55897_c0_g1_i1:450-2396(-)